MEYQIIFCVSVGIRTCATFFVHLAQSTDPRGLANPEPHYGPWSSIHSELLLDNSLRKKPGNSVAIHLHCNAACVHVLFVERDERFSKSDCCVVRPLFAPSSHGQAVKAAVSSTIYNEWQKFWGANSHLV